MKINIIDSLSDLGRGIYRYPIKVFVYAFSCFSVILTIIRGIDYLVPGIQIQGINSLIAVVAVSVFYSLKKVWKPSGIEIKVAHSSTVIEVLFGDLFEQNGIRALAVNEFFDSKIGKPVSDKSLHGIFLQRCLGGHPEAFDKQVDEELKNIEFREIAKRDGKSKSFPIGSTALILANDEKYLVFALSKTDPESCKASSDVTMMWDSLHKLWQRAREEAGGHELNLPLVGSGLSGLGLPTRDLLNLIILSAITETKAREITQIIRVVLHRSRFDDLDLRDVKKHWEEK